MPEEGYTYQIGDIVLIRDKVEPDYGEYGIIKLIEQDEEADWLVWLYIVANNEFLNQQFDPRIGNYYTIIESHSQLIEFIHPATRE